MINFHGFRKKRSYFEGWYLKHQKKNVSIAFIPAFHVDAEGRRTASIQVITGEESHNFPFEEKDFKVSKKKFCVKIGNNLFSKRGIRVELEKEGFCVSGTLDYSSFAELGTDIMGPFRLIPFMQCSHGVLSMIHQLRGTLTINGKSYDFTGGTGYVEKDFGSSFPDCYTWTQCSDWTGKQDCSLMASAADIPFGLLRFKGCICAVWYHGKEYRLATYKGARIVRDTADELVIEQGKYLLSVHRKRTGGSYTDRESGPVQEDRGLLAPRRGSMRRMIKENIACTVHYCFMAGDQVLFDFTADRASFESAGMHPGTD